MLSNFTDEDLCQELKRRAKLRRANAVRKPTEYIYLKGIVERIDNEASRPGDIADAIKNRGMIDCGTNEELFLALAALRDDIDKNQWIIDEANECFGFDDSWMICDKDDMNDRVVYTHYRKATVKDLIERFK